MKWGAAEYGQIWKQMQYLNVATTYDGETLTLTQTKNAEVFYT